MAVPIDEHIYEPLVKGNEDSMTFESLFVLLRVELNNAAHGRGMIRSKFSSTLELPNGQLANVVLTLRGRSINIKVPSVIGSPKIATDTCDSCGGTEGVSHTYDCPEAQD